MRGFWKRQQASRRHPTPPQALAALEEAHCLYAPVSVCSGPVASVGLRDDEDLNVVLACKAHYGRLRKLDARSLAQLERVLVEAFAYRRLA